MPHFNFFRFQAMPPLRRSSRKARQGLSLVSALAFLATMALVGGASFALINTSLRIARRQSDATEALNMADAGVDLGYTWLTMQDPPPSASSLQNMGTKFFGTNGTINAPFGQIGTRLTVRISADASNPSATQKRYLVESRGITPSGATVTVRAFMQQVSFGKYAFFADTDGAGFWNYTSHFEGPFHSNDSDGKPTTIRWKSDAQNDPMFQWLGLDAFSVSGDPRWWKDSVNNAVAPSTAADYKAIAAGGQSSMTTGYKTDANGSYLYDTNGAKIPNSPVIPLPTTNYAQQYAALGQTAPTPATSPPSSSSLPSSVGVTYTPGGGLYIKTPNPSSTTAGDNDVVLQVDSGGYQQIVVSQKINGAARVQTVTINTGNNSTTIVTSYKNQTATSVQTGVPNGMVYSDGNITNLSGTVANNRVAGSGASAIITSRSAMTITTDVANKRDIFLADDVKYSVSRDYTKKQSLDTNYNLYAGTLGLLSDVIIIRASAGSNHNYDLRFDGSILVTTTFMPETYKATPVGTVTQNGGLIQKESSVFGTVNSSGNIASGYVTNYHYDNRFADNPPPFFPTTGNDYDIVSWQRAVNTL